HVPKRASDRLRASFRRWYAMSLYGIGRAQLALKHPDEADAAFDKSLKYARSTGLHEVEIDILGGQANLYNGLARSYAELGRTDDALAASREAVRHIEDVRAELGDSELRSGYF